MMRSSFCLCLVLTAGAARVTAQPPDTDPKSLDAMALEQLLEVKTETATLRKQSLQDAPASVTVVTAEDISRYGYRTLGEALSNVRSFYPNSDGAFTFVGARGFSLLADFNTRFLVLINGHRLTDNVYGSMYYFGEDFPLTLDLVDRIEVVRGPSSALYGSNGLFATINIITKTPTNASKIRVTTTVGSLGEQKLTASTSFAAGREAKVLMSVSASHAAGRLAVFPERAEAGLTPSQTDHVGNGSGYQFFSALTWRNWSVTAILGQYRAIVPTGWYSSQFGNTGTTDLESRNFIEAAWNRSVGENSALRWRTYYDQYRYDGVYDYGDEPRNYDGALGDWVGTELVYNRETGRAGTLTIGSEINADIRNVQYNFEITDAGSGGVRADIFRRAHPRMSFGAFVQHEIRLSSKWTAYLGGRLDATTYDPIALSPRLALVYKRRDMTSYKLMYGRAFRNPSTFERYWEPSPQLMAERIETLEVAREQTLNRRVSLVSSAFHYRLGGLIVGVPVREDTVQYRNASRAQATGLELEVRGQFLEGLETAAGFTIQHTRGIDATERLPNSPVRLGQLRASAPLFRQRLLVGAVARYMGSRLGADGDPFPAATLVDLTLTAPRLMPNLDLQLGIRNLTNQAYSDPLSAEHATRRMPAAGRSMFVRLTWRSE